MLHVLKLIRRRYPERGTSIIATIAVASGIALLGGVALLVL